MKQEITIPVVALFLVLALGCAGCAPGGYGKLRLAGQEVTIGRLAKNWQDYHVAYAGVRVSLPNAIVFDPKNNDTTITLQKYWVPVDNQETLGDLLGWIRSFGIYGPATLYKVMGPGNRVFGYLYTLDTTAYIKVIDDNTLWIGDMTLRPDVKENVFY
jgi:hypothetical protein